MNKKLVTKKWLVWEKQDDGWYIATHRAFGSVLGSIHRLRGDVWAGAAGRRALPCVETLRAAKKQVESEVNM